MLTTQRLLANFVFTRLTRSSAPASYPRSSIHPALGPGPQALPALRIPASSASPAGPASLASSASLAGPASPARCARCASPASLPALPALLGLSAQRARPRCHATPPAGSALRVLEFSRLCEQCAVAQALLAVTFQHLQHRQQTLFGTSKLALR